MRKIESSAREILVPHVRFIDVWERHQQVVYRRCVAWVGGRRDDADEALSRTAIQAIQKWPRHIEDVEHAKAWLLTVARNICVDLHRERSRKREVSLDTEFDEMQDGRPLPGVPGPEDAYVERERRRRLIACIDALPMRLRQTAKLHFLREMAYRDVARALGISEVNVRKRIQHARDLLRSAIIAAPHAKHTAPEPWDETETACENEAPRMSIVAIQVVRADGVEHDALIELPADVVADPHQIERLETYIRKHPRGWMRRLELGRILAASGRLEEAIAQYRFVLSKQPFRNQPRLELGSILNALGRNADAIDMYTGGDSERLQIRAAVLKASTAAEVVDALGRHVAGDPADPLAPSLLHDALLATGHPGEARQQVLRAIEREPSNVPALERAIIARIRAGDDRGEAAARTDELLQHLRRVAAERAAAHGIAALVALARGQRAEARELMTGYVIRHPLHANAWQWLALVRD